MDRQQAQRNVRAAIADALATAPRGTQALLARRCGVDRVQVTRWKTVDGGTTPEQERWPTIESVLDLEPGTLAERFADDSGEVVYVRGRGLPGRFMRADAVVELLRAEVPTLSIEEAQAVVWAALGAAEEHPPPAPPARPSRARRPATTRRP